MVLVSILCRDSLVFHCIFHWYHFLLVFYCYYLNPMLCHSIPFVSFHPAHHLYPYLLETVDAPIDTHRPVRSKDVQGLTVGPLQSRSSRMTQFHRDQAYDGWEVVSPFMQDGTYRSRNSATLGPLTSPPPCALGRRRKTGRGAGMRR